ncbi:MAG TPA: zf-HC2 domain-containing protein [Pyrinomonadaceae bacterium]|nr:zf-HC2 domain-containing protein [Pyrinomonadaceae bacterium]
MEEYKAPGCDQSNELIAFLYGELNHVEAQSFRRHMNGCSSCGQELAAFSDIRSSVVAWRDESLGKISGPASLPNVVIDLQPSRPSALAALREFFSLSPAWLKGAVAFATLLFCLMAGFAVMRLQDNPMTPVVSNESNPESTTYSEEQVKALVDRRVKDELDRIKATDQAPTSQIVNDVNALSNRRKVMRNVQVATSSTARRPLSKVERDQLAADLRLVAINNDSELDLLDDRINR